MKPMIRTSLLLGVLLLPAFSLFSQTITQTIRGRVEDEASGYPLESVQVVVPLLEGKVLGALTDSLGYYRVEKVPVGRQTVRFRFLGYQEVVLDNIEVTSAKEVILNMSLSESSMELEEVELTARRSGEALNELAFVSAREFSVEETNRYAGSRGEPARMASNYAGVQGADDSRNDIVIRGNTPQGVLWRLEGINIPNPNHFSIPGTGGGPVTILNNKFLTNSDFFTGAFPAEYGNGIAGVFDLKMRNGNDEKHEFSGQLGFLGTELTAEGPISRESRASYLAMYRYSTLQLFGFLGINVGTDAIPQYQDGAFRVNLPQKNGATLSIWGVGGLSTVDIVLSEQAAPDTATLLFGSNDRDQYFSSNTGVVAASYTYPINLNTLFKASVGVSNAAIFANHDQIFRRVENEKFVVDSLPAILDYTFQETKYSAYVSLTKKIDKRQSLKLGVNADWFQMRYIDSVRVVRPGAGTNGETLLDPWKTRWDARQGAPLVQPYVQYRLKLQDRLDLTAGLTSLYFGINDSSFSPIEPRLGLSYQLREGQKLSLGLGLHSQMQSPYLYFYSLETVNGDPQEHNLENMGLTKSAHAVLSYDRMLGRSMRLKAETYYQYLYNIPVQAGNSSFSLINAGSGFSRLFPDTLVNEGTGRNYGLELTLEKFFSNNYYFLLTGSLFDAKYRGSDGELRNTVFNGRFAFNALFAKEFNIGESSTLNLGANVTYIGGRWYGPVDTVASARELEIIFEDETMNTLQFRPYFRADAKVSFRWNRPRVTHELSVDFVNIFNIQNILTLTYAPDHPSGQPIREEYQLGFLPIFFYKIDF
jgi:hypothetical protein